MSYSLSPNDIEQNITPKIEALEAIYRNIAQGNWEKYTETQPKRDAYVAMNAHLKLCIEEFKKIRPVDKDTHLDFNMEIRSLEKTLSLYQHLYQKDSDDAFIEDLDEYYRFASLQAETARNRKIFCGIMLTLGLLGIAAIILTAVFAPYLLLGAVGTAWIGGVIFPSSIATVFGMAGWSRYGDSDKLPKLMMESAKSGTSFFPLAISQLKDPEQPEDSLALKDRPEPQYQSNLSQQYAAKAGA